LESGAAELFFPLSVLGVTKEIVVERVGPGDVLAWSALVGPYSLTLSGRCCEGCLVRRFARERLRALFEKRPSVGYAIMESLAAVVGGRLDQFQNLWIREVQSKIVDSLG
jgi:CRP-like cAMP-binding protein